MRWFPASHRGPVSPSGAGVIDHPDPQGIWNEVDLVPLLIAPDPGGVAPRAGAQEFAVDFSDVAVQHSPLTNWSPGTPYPGPPSRVWHYVDLDSQRYWGRTGQGRLIWSGETEFSADLAPLIPQDLVQHIDSWNFPAWGYPSMARNRPSAFGDQVPVLSPTTGPSFELAPG